MIKIGGNVIDDDASLMNFLSDFSKVEGRKILVHGGGKIASRIGDRLGIQSNYVQGRRITDGATIDLVTMVYGGMINKKIVASLQSLGTNAIGLTGADANLIPATKRPVKTIDYGWVGDVESSAIPAATWKVLLDHSLVPVVAPLTHDGNKNMLNTNADTIASSVAVALSAHYDVRLIYCFEKKGVLSDVYDDESVIPMINREKYSMLLEQNRLFEGIIPKIDNAFDAIGSGVREVLIGHAADLLENTREATKGTLIIN